jgi:CO dehydrogenase maturation factor
MGEIVSEADNITVMDMEASLEHLSRGTVRHVDVLLIVTEPYYRSLETARRTLPLARALGINHIYAVVNKYRSAEDEKAVMDFCRTNDLEIIAKIPFDTNVTQADLEGKSLYDFNPKASVVKEVEKLAADLRERVPLNNSSASKILTKPNC